MFDTGAVFSACDPGERLTGLQLLTYFSFSLVFERWYVLFVFGLVAFTQGLAWITFSSVPHAAENYYNIIRNSTVEKEVLDDGDIYFLLNWGPIAYSTSRFLFIK